MRTLLALYSIVVGLSGCADRFLLFPTTRPIDPQGARQVKVESAPNRFIEIWIARVSHARYEPQAYILEFTGNGNRAEDIATFVANRWRPHDVEVWAVNYPGYGGSTGPATLSSIAPAALRAFDALSAHARDRPIIVEANSLGTTASLYVAAHRPVKGLLLQSPPPLRQVIVGHHGWWNLWLLAWPVSLGVPDELNSVANAKRCTVPAVFITGSRDDYVPPKYQQMVIDAYQGPKETLSYDADHNGSPDSSARGFRDALEWLWHEAVEQ